MLGNAELAVHDGVIVMAEPGKVPMSKRGVASGLSLGLSQAGCRVIAVLVHTVVGRFHAEFIDPNP